VAVEVMVLLFAQRTEILGPSELGTVCVLLGLNISIDMSVVVYSV
jgi:hypothetical protein